MGTFGQASLRRRIASWRIGKLAEKPIRIRSKLPERARAMASLLPSSEKRCSHSSQASSVEAAREPGHMRSVKLRRSWGGRMNCSFTSLGEDINCLAKRSQCTGCRKLTCRFSRPTVEMLQWGLRADQPDILVMARAFCCFAHALRGTTLQGRILSSGHNFRLLRDRNAAIQKAAIRS